MKLTRRMVVLSLVLVFSVLSMAAAPLAVKYPFAGVWKGIDAVDGSKNELRITAWNKVYNVQFTDKSVAACGGGLAKGRGGGTVVNNVLYTSFSLKCKSNGVIINGTYNVALQLGAGQLTVVDGVGTVYNLKTRAGCNGR